MKKHPFQEWHDKTPIEGGLAQDIVDGTADPKDVQAVVRKERAKAWNAAMDYIAEYWPKALNRSMAKGWTKY